MEYRPLDITVISASDLKNVNMFMRMGVYVVVTISGEQSRPKRKTHVDRSGGVNPEWNHRIKFTLEDSCISQNFISFKLRAERSLGDKDVGEVAVPLCNLLEDFNSNRTRHEHEVEYQVRTSGGKARGTLKFSFNFGEKFTQQIQAIAPLAVTQVVNTTNSYSPPTMYQPPATGNYPQNLPPMAYGMHQHPQSMMVAGYVYPGYGGYPPSYQYSGGYPPGCGYPVQYAYMPVQQLKQADKGSGEKKKKSGFGSKLGLRLGVGILGGWLLGDMVSNVGDVLSGDMMDGGGDVVADTAQAAA